MEQSILPIIIVSKGFEYKYFVQCRNEVAEFLEVKLGHKSEYSVKNAAQEMRCLRYHDLQ